MNKYHKHSHSLKKKKKFNQNYVILSNFQLNFFIFSLIILKHKNGLKYKKNLKTESSIN